MLERFQGLLLGVLMCWTPLASATTAAPLLFVAQPQPPYAYLQGSRPVGAMVDILQAACAELTMRCMVQLVPWRRALSLVEQGAAEGVLSVVDIPARRRSLHVLRPVLAVSYAFFAPQESAFRYAGPASLRGHPLVVYGPSGVSEALLDASRELPDVKVSVVIDNLTAFRMLAAGRFGSQGLVLANRDLGRGWLLDGTIRGLKEAGVLQNLSYTFGLSRASAAIGEKRVEDFDRVLNKLCREGRLHQIAVQYGVKAAPCAVPTLSQR